jgi:hypothetical protein
VDGTNVVDFVVVVDKFDCCLRSSSCSLIRNNFINIYRAINLRRLERMLQN